MTSIHKGKIIFFTGGVISSIGKGIAAASLGRLLVAHGFKVTMMKLDPYLNIDPGTMSPFQHGEVFVTDDGAETDLDLGHYERFLGVNMKKGNNFTAGRIFQRVIDRERKGEYDGKTVQVVPHITDEIKSSILNVAKDSDFCIVEIGGTVGDIESLPFLEAIRQLRIELGKKTTAYVHLTFVPYISVAGENKTKPTQHSVKEMRSIGIQPDFLVCRTQQEINESEKDKIALFSNVDKHSVFFSSDVAPIYRVPLLYMEQEFDLRILEHFDLPYKGVEQEMDDWSKIIKNYDQRTNKVVIGILGKYVQLSESYKSLSEAVFHASMVEGITAELRYFDTEDYNVDDLQFVDAVIVPGGFGLRGVEGMIQAVEYVRKNKIPFLGICLGMQVAIIELARNIANLEMANSIEFCRETKHPVIYLLEKWETESGEVETRDESELRGGTMRLGGSNVKVKEGSLLFDIYKSTQIRERHRHRYEFNNKYRECLEEAGVVFSGTFQNLVEVIELDKRHGHPWFVGCQYHPEFISTPTSGHPLFIALIKAATLHSTGVKS